MRGGGGQPWSARTLLEQHTDEGVERRPYRIGKYRQMKHLRQSTLASFEWICK